MNAREQAARPERLRWLPPMILIINLAGIGIVLAYSRFNLRPFLPPHETTSLQPLWLFLLITFFIPTSLSTWYLRPIYRWLRERRLSRPDEPETSPPRPLVERAANIPVLMGALCLGSWALLDIMVLVRITWIFPELTAGLVLHFFIRPLLAGLIASTAVTFLSEHLCRTHLWPIFFAGAQLQENARLYRFKVGHRLFLLWLAISFLPLSAAAFTAAIRMESLQTAADPLLLRVIMAIILIATSAAVGGAWLAWLVSRSIGHPLRRLEGAMAKLRGGDFTIRVPVTSTDEISALEEGFNLMTSRLAGSYEALEARNRELAEALDRVSFLEKVKYGLDRFVPDTVRRLIEEDPDSPALEKRARDVTVLFLDIEGYSRLSEALPRERLTEIIERYFSSYLSDIRAEGGDINETAGDGLMILFQEGEPPAHAAAAVRAALAIRDKTAGENAGNPEGFPPIAVNIGISSGECEVGSTRLRGISGERWTFTATGPVTNLAARLGDRAEGGQILLSPETARRVAEKFSLRSMGAQSLKNLAEPVETWEALKEGRPENTAPAAS